ncbi:MAG: A/G-specific adenine glycosylase, partial [Patescibacteria group bacterium]
MRRNSGLADFQKIIRDYYRGNRRRFPWRETTDSYRILVSEIMLQQTQVGRVREKYPVFVHTFPDFETLARAPLSRILHAWSGMGYNRRTLALKRIAET